MKKYILEFDIGQGKGFAIELTDTKKEPITDILSGVTKVELREKKDGTVLWTLP